MRNKTQNKPPKVFNATQVINTHKPLNGNYATKTLKSSKALKSLNTNNAPKLRIQIHNV